MWKGEKIRCFFKKNHITYFYFEGARRDYGEKLEWHLKNHVYIIFINQNKLFLIILPVYLEVNIHTEDGGMIIYLFSGRLVLD